MTTRAGFVGLLTGLAASLILLHPLAITWPAGFTPWGWLTVATAAILMTGGGALAARWSDSVQPLRCAALGGLAGGLAGTLVFCLLGAAAAGLSGAAPLFDAVGEIARQRLQIETIAAIVRQTQVAFLTCFWGGIGLGWLGGWLAHPRRAGQTDLFDKSEPQMALNAAITAVPASVIAAALAAALFSRLADFVGDPLARPVLDLPLAASLLLALLSHLALTLVVPHEARQAEHLCGMDEVKMAAYVGIGAAPVLALLLLLVNTGLFSKPMVAAALLASAGLSLKNLQILRGQILPGRAAFPAPQDNSKKREAKWFGTIAASRGPRLVVLCIGCGLLMVLPLHVTVFATLINLNNLLLDSALAQSAPEEVARKLFITQTLVSAGGMGASAAALTSVYLFYLNLGRWFSQWNARQLS